jgi:membrane-associated HD superfamily phosphohydrolase
MNNTQNNAAGIKSLRILYYAMLSGTIILAAVIYFVSEKDKPSPIEMKDNILVIVLFIAAACLTASALLWKKAMAKIRDENKPLPVKFEAYRAAAIKRYAITEFSILLSVICYFLTLEMKLYFIIAVLIVHFLTLYPITSKIAVQIGENAEDIEKL